MRDEHEGDHVLGISEEAALLAHDNKILKIQ